MNELDFCEHKKFTISFTNLNEVKFVANDFDEEEFNED